MRKWHMHNYNYVHTVYNIHTHSVRKKSIFEAQWKVLYLLFFLFARARSLALFDSFSVSSIWCSSISNARSCFSRFVLVPLAPGGVCHTTEGDDIRPGSFCGRFFFLFVCSIFCLCVLYATLQTNTPKIPSKCWLIPYVLYP